MTPSPDSPRTQAERRKERLRLVRGFLDALYENRYPDQRLRDYINDVLALMKDHEQEAAQQALEEAARRVEAYRPGTICKCGSAKDYHRPEDRRDHEYEPRYALDSFVRSEILAAILHSRETGEAR